MGSSRQRVTDALNHVQGDRVPMDFGGTPVSGMHVSIVYLLRQAMKLDPPGEPVKVVEPYQMLGEIGLDLIEAIGIDVVGLGGTRNFFGFKNEQWKEWTLFDDTPVLVPECFNTELEPNGSIFMYPEGDRSVPPSAIMPEGGFYFDSLSRQEPIDDENLNVQDNLQEFGPLSEEELEHFATQAELLYTQTDKAIVISLPGTAFGDIALVPAPWLKHSKGIRDVQEWYISTALRRDYIYEVFERQCEIALDNLQKIYDAVGNKPTAAFVSGTDFGMQTGPLISPEAYRDLYQPFHKKVNKWIHANTEWKTFIHTCGSIMPMIEDIIESGFDILNPVQCSAVDMDPLELKEKFGDRITFWGGGTDTQKTLALGSPDQVRQEVRQRVEIFSKDGGFVFNSVHNIQTKTPLENILAMFEAFEKAR